MAKHIQMPPIYPIPQNWTWVELRKLTKIISGYPFNSKLFSDLVTDGLPLVRIRDVVRGYTETYTPEDCPEQYIIHKNDILIGMDGDFNVGRWQEEAALLNQRVCYIQSISNLLLNDYLFYFLPGPLKQINDVTPSVTVKHLSTKTIESIMIPLPPIEEQIRLCELIRSLFEKLDEAKEKAQEVADGYDARKAAILHKAFTGELIGRDCVNTVMLETIVDTIRIGPFGSALHQEDYIVNGIPVINPKHIIDQQIKPEAKVTISADKAVELSSYTLRENDIILGRRGEMGRSAPIGQQQEGWICGTGSMIIRLKTGYNASFYSQIIGSQSVVQYLEENSVGSTLKNLNEKIVRHIPIPDFSVDEQKKLVKILESLLKKEQQAKELAENVLSQIDLMKKAILSRAFRGELGTNAPEEESAVELLKRIV